MSNRTPASSIGPRALSLTGWHYKSLWHRIIFDWAQEIVAIVSAAVLLGLFLYIANDFLNDKISILKASLTHRLVTAGYLICTILWGYGVGRSIRKLWNSPRSLSHFFRQSGESPKTVWLFQILVLLINLTVALGLALWILGSTIGLTLNHHEKAIGYLTALIATLVGSLIKFHDHNSEIGRLWQGYSHGRFLAMTSFRLMQMLRRNRLIQMIWVLTLTLSVGQGLLSIQDFPFFMRGLLAMTTSILMSLPLVIQLREDLSSAWSERSMGVSHQEIIRIYLGLSCFINAVFVTITVSVLLATGTSQTFHSWIQLLGIVILGPTLTPAMMFQVDPHHPVLTLLVLVFAVFFLGTAVLAHPLALALLPLCYVYAARYQQGRYYRA